MKKNGAKSIRNMKRNLYAFQQNNMDNIFSSPPLHSLKRVQIYVCLETKRSEKDVNKKERNETNAALKNVLHLVDSQ